MNKLGKYLQHNGITQRSFAKRIGTSPNNLGLLISGASNPTIRLAIIIEIKTGGLVTLYDWVRDEWRKEAESKDES